MSPFKFNFSQINTDLSDKLFTIDFTLPSNGGIDLTQYLPSGCNVNNVIPIQVFVCDASGNWEPELHFQVHTRFRFGTLNDIQCWKNSNSSLIGSTQPARAVFARISNPSV